MYTNIIYFTITCISMYIDTIFYQFNTFVMIRKTRCSLFYVKETMFFIMQF
jgi:hypothetical protein